MELLDSVRGKGPGKPDFDITATELGNFLEETELQVASYFEQTVNQYWNFAWQIGRVSRKTTPAFNGVISENYRTVIL